MIEELAKILHNAYWEESKRQKRVHDAMIPYEELSEDMKNISRACAGAALDFFGNLRLKEVVDAITIRRNQALLHGR